MHTYEIEPLNMCPIGNAMSNSFYEYLRDFLILFFFKVVLFYV